MKKNTKKMVSALLAALLIMQAIPMEIFANEIDTEIPGTVINEEVQAPELAQDLIIKEETSEIIEQKEVIPAEEMVKEAVSEVKEEVKNEAAETVAVPEETKTVEAPVTKPSVQTFEITWLSDDGSVLAVTEAEKNTKPVFEGTPVKEADAHYTYEFSGWNPTIRNATSNKTYTAKFTKKAIKYNVTVNFTNIMKPDGTMITSSEKNSLGAGSSWSFTQKKLDNKVVSKSFTYNGIKYTYANKWVLEDGTMFNGTYKIDGNTLTSDIVINLSPIYDKEEPWHLNFRYIDRISTGSGSWSNLGSASGYSHTFAQPAAQPHYMFVNWEDEATGDIYGKGDKYVFPSKYMVSGLTTDVNIYAKWQPSATVQYYSADGKQLLNETEAFENVAVNGWRPADNNGEFLGWFDAPLAADVKEEDAKEELMAVLGSDEICALPSVTTEKVERTVRKVYARFTTDYTVEHNLENLDGTYSVAENETETHEDAVVGSVAEAEAREFAGYTYDGNTEGTLYAAIIRRGLNLSLYYNRNSYSVSYSYTGDVPAGASQLPEAAQYKYGADVSVAEDAAAAGYTFSGWDKADFSMSANDIVISGSFKANEDTKYTVEHYIEELDGSFTVKETENLIGTTDTQAVANAKAFEGFTFDALAEGTVASGNIAGDGSLVLRLYYTRNSYSVSYSYTGNVPAGSGQLPEAVQYKFGANVKIAEDAKAAAGYRFNGWDKADFTMPANDIVISGSFSANKDTQYTVEHYIEGLDGSFSVKETEILKGITDEKAVANAKEFEGFTFDGSAEDTVASGNIAGDGSLVLRLYYTRNSYKVSYEFEGDIPTDASQLPEAAQYKFGAEVSVAEDAAAAGYTFSGWDKADFSMPANDIVIIGSFKANEDTQYTVEHYIEELDGSFTIKETENLIGTTDTEAVANAKEFEGFTFDDAAEDTVASGNIAGDGSLVLRLYYTRNSYKVSYEIEGDIPGNASGLPETAEYKFGANVEIAENAKADGFEFSGWNMEEFEMPAEDVVITGSFTAIPAVIEETVPATQSVRPAASAVAEPEIIETVDEIEEIQEIIPLAETVEDQAMPAAVKKVWALVNLISTILTAIISALMAVTFFSKNKENDEESDNDENKKWSKFFGIIPAAVAIITFIITENLKNKMVLTDKWTPFMIIVLLINVALAYITRNDKEENDEDKEVECA